jgi:hypothetical protein
MENISENPTGSADNFLCSYKPPCYIKSTSDNKEKLISLFELKFLLFLMKEFGKVNITIFDKISNGIANNFDQNAIEKVFVSINLSLFKNCAEQSK